MKLFKRSLMLLVLVALLVPAAASLWAQTTAAYDKYAALVELPKQPSTLKRVAQHFLIYPFDLIRYPSDKGAIFVEKHHVMEKIQWAYDTAEKYGFTPRLNLAGLATLNVGTEVDFIRAFRLREQMPDVIASSWIYYTGGLKFNAGAKLGLARIANTGFRTEGLVNYEKRKYEHYYGIGPHTSAGDGYIYSREQTDLEYKFGYKPSVMNSADVSVGYRNVNISGGRDGGRGQFQQGIFGNQVPGLHGDELFILKTELQHDTRNLQGLSTRGGHQRAAFSYNEGLYGSDARYFKYEAEATKYISLGTERRVLAMRAFGEHNSALPGHYVPFHQMPRLGGHGAFDHLSETLRAYDVNRFTDRSALLFNLEYRYNIWEYRDWKTDAVIFTDCGQVFGNFSKYRFENFRTSYGTGLRTSLAGEVVLSLELAHGDEGTTIYAKSSTPF